MTGGNSHAQAQPQAGWYADPYDAGVLRYWDGVAWTAHTQPALPLGLPSVELTPGAPAPRHRIGLAAILGVIGFIALLGVALIAIATLAMTEDGMTEDFDAAPALVTEVPALG